MPTLALLVFAAAALAAPELSDRLQITEVAGPPDVTVIRSAGSREDHLKRGENLFVGDRVEVAPHQMVSIASYDGSSWKLSPGTSFRAEARKPDKVSLAYWVFGLAKGAMWGHVPKGNASRAGAEGFRLKVHTKTAALAVRGTEFVMSGDEAHPAVDVIEGRVWWGTDPAFPEGTYKEVAAGQHAEIGADKRVNVTDSKGDKAKLLRDYGLFLGEEAKATHGTPQSCAALGLGWRSGDGSSGGECFKQTGETE